MSSTVAEIDVRTIAPYERHAQLFARFDALQTGEAFVIVNDHNPVPLHMQLDQPVLSQPSQMRTGRGCSHPRNHSQLGTGARVAVHQRAEHPRPCRLSNGRRNLGDIGVMTWNIHISLLSELQEEWMREITRSY